MSRWLRGKQIGALVFLVIAGLVIGGLGWATRAALKLEEEQAIAAAQADQAAKMRLALWRLDSLLFTDLVKEASRPYSSYIPKDFPGEVRPPQEIKTWPLYAMELWTAPGVDTAAWVKRHFLVAPETFWHDPGVFRGSATNLGLFGGPSFEPTDPPGAVEPLIKDLASLGHLQRHLDHVRDASIREGAIRPSSATFGLTEKPRPQADSLLSSPQSQMAEQQRDRDATLRMNQAKVARKQAGFANNIGQVGGREKEEKGARYGRLAISPGPLIAGWVAGDRQEQFVVSRFVDLQGSPLFEVAVLDWPGLQTILADEVSDLFPEARFRPVPEGEAVLPDRALTALPVEIDPGTATLFVASRAWTPLRIGLLLAWGAALVALTAVGLGGWSLLENAERRTRFVSAVTHELRTPLTTLRLYLDMLARGLVRDEQRGEYLQTLNAEADRLNRLVGNVLDFSRLENQRPRLEMTSVRLAELLDQVRSDWVDRCRQAKKDLVIDDQAGDDFKLTTDVRVVSQILGNLIDNACKYSQDAADARIWLRAHRQERRLILEVEDRGQGVAARESRSIFRPFKRGRADDVTTSGVGLGLALSRRWAEVLGGTLTLDAVNGRKGACFRLEVPLWD